MKIRIIAFATASDLLGQGQLEVELADGSRIADLRQELLARSPDLERLWPRLAVAIDGKMAAEDHPLHDNAEVALLPPVSGGKDGERPEVLVDGKIDVAEVQDSAASRACGAVLLFLGTVRNHHRGREVVRLTYSAYRPMAIDRLHAICTELETRHEALRVRIVHRLGDVPIGEPSVVIAVASPHREAAYDVSRIALERLKREVPIWKREHYADGEVVWREEEPLNPTAGRPAGSQATGS